MEEIVKHNQEIGSDILVAITAAFIFIILIIIICTYEFKRNRTDPDKGV